jgi:predicted metal-dependent hydrolase
MALWVEKLERTEVALERGREAYVSGRFFEAHEAWVQAWRRESGSTRGLLQGLIQAAGAYHKMSQGRQPLGMTILLDQALALLDPLPDAFGGLDLAGFRVGLRRSRREAAAWQAGGPMPAGPAHLGPARREPEGLRAVAQWSR